MKKKKITLGGVLLRIVVALVVIYIVAPLVVMVGTSFTSGSHMQFPPQGFSLKWYKAFFESKTWTRPAVMSVELAAATTVGSVLLGSLSAYGIDKSPRRNMWMSFFTSPLIVPQIITGLSLLQLVNVLGLTRNFTIIWIGHVIVTLPYVIRTMCTSFYRFNTSIEEASLTLGANKGQTFFRVVLPSVKSGVISSAFFAFISSFSNLSVSVFLTTARNNTLTIQMYSTAKFNPEPVLAAICSMILGITIVVMILVEKFAGMENMM